MIPGMMTNPYDDSAIVRHEIAAAAARLVAQDGADYGTAKRKAARLILGDAQPGAQVLPDNAQIEHEVRLYNALFLSSSQPARLLRLRTIALQLMEALRQFQPLITGAVVNGTAGAHDDIHLQLFADSAKEIHIFLLNKNMTLDMTETPHFKGPRYDAVETANFLWSDEGVHAALYELDDLRGARKSMTKTDADGTLQRTDSAGLRALLAGGTKNE